VIASRAVISVVVVNWNAGRALARTAAQPKIWLDRVRKPLLDHSVPQIGGTAAHARGFTGAGVTVAVLDTGVDSTHPDLAGKVIAAEDFTGDGAGVGDVVGHGTHVASIIAGTGAASNGQFAGVAPEAQLVSGRVCFVFGCPDSAILAGMSWAAVDQHARVVNLSLGGIDTPEIDPLEDAVNQLSAQFGTLFVIAAGNDGSSSSIESPGSADAAITVGAVDRDDELAFFSSRGPRTGDRAIKPDVTAPGFDIVAARAGGVPPIGEPVGEFYMRLSGTSMATPHVSGAAALLLQQHADWTGPQLKAQLLATASPNPALTAFDQGAGRIDVDRGTRQDVSADPPSLSLGIATFPHDDDPQIVRTVHYHNGGSAPLALALAASLSRTAGGPTPPGMIQVEPAEITVPAGGVADATVTVTTSGDLADGLYSGALVATGGDVRVETAIGVDRAVETFDIGIDALDQQGAPASALLFVFGIEGVPTFVFINGHTTLHAPRGLYAIDASVTGLQGAFLSYPRLRVDGNTAISFDSRLARPIAVDVGDPTVAQVTTSWAYVDFAQFRGVSSTTFGFSRPGGHLGPDAAPDEFVGFAVATQTDTDAFGSPKLIYNLAHSERGHVPTGWTETVAPGQLATVTARHAGSADAEYNKGSIPLYVDPAQGLFGAGLTLLNAYSGPFDRTERFFAPGFLWEDDFLDNRVLPEQPDFPALVAEQFAFRDHGAGEQATEQWNQATFGPAFASAPVFDGTTIALGSTASRVGDQLFIQPSIVADNAAVAHNSDTVFDTRRIALFRDGALVAEHQFPGDPFDVPPGAATYRYEHDLARPADLFDLSPQISAAWTFRSQHVAGDAPTSLPLIAMRFAPPVDQNNRTSARMIVLPIAFQRPIGAAALRIVRASLEVSFDDGAHWSRVPIAVMPDRAVAIVTHPATGKFVSLRGSATDVQGNRVDLTIAHAYGLAP